MYPVKAEMSNIEMIMKTASPDIMAASLRRHEFGCNAGLHLPLAAITAGHPPKKSAQLIPISPSPLATTPAAELH